MKKYNKIEYTLYIGIIIIIISLIANIVYSNSQRLNSPVFFEHYYEISTSESGIGVTFYYLTNANDNTKVIGIDFPDMNDDVNLSIKYTNERQYKYYDIKEVAVEFDENIINIENNMALNNAIIFFSNGDKKEVDLGKIIIKNEDNKNICLDPIFGSSSSNNITKDIFKIEKPIIINSITTALLEETNGLVKMRVITDDSDSIELIENLKSKNDEKLDEIVLGTRNKKIKLTPFEELQFPIHANYALNINTDFNIKDERKYNFYRVIYYINYESKDGQKGSAKLLAEYRPYFSDKDIKYFLESRGE